MAKKMTEIRDEAIEMAKGLNIAVDPEKLFTTIRQTRAKSDIAIHHPKFNPDGHVTGCNARAALSFYDQMFNAKVKVFNPDYELQGKAKAKGIAKKS